MAFLVSMVGLAVADCDPLPPAPMITKVTGMKGITNGKETMDTTVDGIMNPLPLKSGVCRIKPKGDPKWSAEATKFAFVEPSKDNPTKTFTINLYPPFKVGTWEVKSRTSKTSQKPILL